MFRTVGVLLCAAALACPSVSAAAEPAPPPTARALDCAARYNKAMHMEDTMAGMMRGMMPVLIERQEELMGSRLTDEQKRLMVEAMAESAGVMGARMQDQLVPTMAATFTEAELCALAAFYESPEGQGVVAKMPAYSDAAAVVIAAFMPAFEADMAERICKRLGCDAARKPGRTAT